MFDDQACMRYTRHVIHKLFANPLVTISVCVFILNISIIYMQLSCFSLSFNFIYFTTVTEALCVWYLFCEWYLHIHVAVYLYDIYCAVLVSGAVNGNFF